MATPLTALAVMGTAPLMVPHHRSVAPPVDAETAMGWDIGHYSFDLTVDEVNEEVFGTVTIDAVQAGEGSFVLHANGPEVTTITVDGTPWEWEQVGEEVVLYPSPSAESVQVVVEYRGGSGTMGDPWNGVFGQGMQWYPGRAFTDSEPEGARRWAVLHDAPNQRASVDWTLRVAPGRVAVGNGEEAAEVERVDGRDVWRWSMEQTLPSYLYAFHVGALELDVQSGAVEVWTWAEADKMDDALVGLSNGPDILDWFSELFGPYPYGHYGNVISPFAIAGMENPTVVTFSDEYIGAENAAASEYINAHEMAHHWFGDHVTLADWSDIWLNEGFATYGQMLWDEHNGESEALAETLEVMITGYAYDDAPLADPDELFSTTIYYKGALVLHMLRGQIGDELFFAVLRDWVANHGESSVTSQQFVDQVETTTGEDMAWFFDPWLYGLGVPTWDTTYAVTDVGGGQWQLDVRIEQDDPQYTMPIDLDVRLSDGSTVREQVVVEGSGVSFTGCYDMAPWFVEPDPDYWVLADRDRAGIGTPGPVVCAAGTGGDTGADTGTDTGATTDDPTVDDSDDDDPTPAKGGCSQAAGGGDGAGGWSGLWALAAVLWARSTRAKGTARRQAP
jgi:aminopeptidase N